METTAFDANTIAEAIALDALILVETILLNVNTIVERIPLDAKHTLRQQLCYYI